MPFVKDSLSLLIEASGSDLKRNTKSIVRESAVRSNYHDIEEASSPVIYGANMIPVMNIDGKYYTEMNFLYPYMKTNGIKSIAEALNDVAMANNLDDNSVGLLIESEDEVTGKLDDALECGDQCKAESVMNKINKAIDLTKNLKDKGINVIKKASNKK
jgi:hypothetical protein